MKNGPKLTAPQRRLVIGVGAGAVVIAAIGFAGSYASVHALAQEKGFGDFSYAFPIGIDAGILVLLGLDLILTWLRIPFPLLRQTAWLLTVATIAFNGAAAWPDPIGVGMHAIIPILFVVAVEAARHAIGRTADITADKHMESVRLVRWLLAPWSTFRLWRRMKLWELRSYEQVILLERQRLVEKARLRGKYGRRWRSTAPVEAVMALRLTRYGRELTLVQGVLDIEQAPALASAQQSGASGAPAGMLGSAPALPALPLVNREPMSTEPVSRTVSRGPVSPNGEPAREPSFGEHAAGAIQITLTSPPPATLAELTEPPAQPASREPSPEPQDEPDPEPHRTNAPAAEEEALAVLRAFTENSLEPDSVQAGPAPQPAAIPAPVHSSLLSAEQRAADAAWAQVQAAARRTSLNPAHHPEPVSPREPKMPEPLSRPVSRPVSREPLREPSPEPMSPTAVSREPVSPDREPDGPETDEIEQQITALASRLRQGDQLTKKLAAQLLGVSDATGGRRLKAARTRIDEGTGFYP